LVAKLTPHPATLIIPLPPAEPSEHADFTEPLEILADGRILVGRDVFERAKQSGVKRLPVKVVAEPSDGVELYVLDRTVASQWLTDDQRACLAVEYAERLGARFRHERARKAAAGRYGRRVASRTTGATKQDSRAIACSRFTVPAKKFRQLRRLKQSEPALFAAVLTARTTGIEARKTLQGRIVARAEAERQARSPALEVPSMLLGDCRKIIPTLPNDFFTAIITDPPYGVKYRQSWRGGQQVEIVGDEDAATAIALFRQMLRLVRPKMRKSSFLASFVPAKHESLFRNAVTQSGWKIIAYPIWVKNTRMLFPGVNVASLHERMLLAVRGGAALRRPLEDVFQSGRTRASTHPTEKPIAIAAKLIDAMTVAGEAVLDPFAGTGSTVIAALAAGRRAVGIEVERQWHSQSVDRITNLETHQKRASK
jgi:site-specific DNA-methyltransferase (adenine-specific)